MSSRVVVVGATFGWWLPAATLEQWAHLGVGGGEVGDQSVPVTWLLAIADDAISLASRCAEVIRDTRLKLTGGRYNGIGHGGTYRSFIRQWMMSLARKSAVCCLGNKGWAGC